MIVTKDAVVHELADLRAALQADGGDLDVVLVTDARVDVRLVVGPETCEDCILPQDALERIVGARLRSALAVDDVRLEDPRV